MPGSNNDILLQTILDGIKSAREDISEMQKSNFTRLDGKEMQDEMTEHFDKMNTKIDEHTSQLKDLKVAEGLNTEFRKGFVSAGKYIAGALFVSGLGVVSAVIPMYLNHAIAPGAAVAAPTAAPFEVHKPHIELPKNQKE